MGGIQKVLKPLVLPELREGFRLDAETRAKGEQFLNLDGRPGETLSESDWALWETLRAWLVAKLSDGRLHNFAYCDHLVRQALGIPEEAADGQAI